MRKVFCVIPVFNRYATTAACLRLLQKQSYQNLAIIVSDGKSTDGTVARARSEFPEVTVLNSDIELWWAGAMKSGIEEAIRYADADDFLLMMNNDTLFDENFVSTLVNESLNNGDAAVGALTRDCSPPHQILDAGEFVDWTTYNFPVKTEIQPGDKECTSVDVLPGRGSIIPIKYIRNFGNVDADRFPHYIADYEFFARMKLNGVKLMVTYKTEIFSDTTQTGLHDNGAASTLRGRFNVLTSRRSSSNVVDHFRFIDACAPKIKKSLLKRKLLFRSLNRLFLLEERGILKIVRLLRNQTYIIADVLCALKSGDLKVLDLPKIAHRVFWPAYFVFAADVADMPVERMKKAGILSRPDALGRIYILKYCYFNSDRGFAKVLLSVANSREAKCSRTREDFRMFLDVAAGRFRTIHRSAHD